MGAYRAETARGLRHSDDAPNLIPWTLYPEQRAIADRPERFVVVCEGRRAGKTWLGMDRIITAIQEGKRTAWFAPTYGMLTEIGRAHV